jgi:hypothetical protein
MVNDGEMRMRFRLSLFNDSTEIRFVTRVWLIEWGEKKGDFKDILVE